MDSGTLERFYSYVGPVDPATGCWPWVGATNDYGYAILNVQKRSTLAHRLAFEHAHGPTEADLDHVRERCPLKHCVNPTHCEEVTRGENVQRARDFNRTATVCRDGHPLTHRTSNGWRRCAECRFDGDLFPL
jgi:hypothetical protein